MKWLSQHVGTMWVVTGAIVAIALSAAFTVLGYSPADYDVARSCFWIGGATTMTALILSIGSSPWPFWLRLVVSALSGALVCVLLVEVLHFTTRRQAAAAKSQHTAPALGTVASFAVRVDQAFTAPHDGPMFVYRSNDIAGVFLTPVGIAITARFTNAGPQATTIDDYAVSIRADDQWHRLQALHIVNPRELFLIPPTGPKTAYPAAFFPGVFDELVRNASVPAGASVKGWMFFQWPKALNRPGVPPRIESFLFEIEDVLGRTQRVLVPFPAPTGSTTLRDAGFNTGEAVDLSLVPLRLPHL